MRVAFLLCLPLLFFDSLPAGPYTPALSRVASINPDTKRHSEAERARPLPGLVLHWDMAGGKNPKIRHSSWGVWQHGWQGFIDRQVAQRLVGHEHAVILHNPFGRSDIKAAMEFRQWQSAQGTPLAEGFVKAWKPIAAEREVIGYLGSLRADKQLRAGLDAGEQWAIDAAFEAVQPLVDAGMSIGLDAMIESPEDEGMWRHFIKPLIQQQAERGLRVYIEPRPELGSTNLYGLPIIAVQSHWKMQSRSKRMAPDEVLTGPKIMLWSHSGYKPTVVGMNRFIADVQEMGEEYIPAIAGNLYTPRQHEPGDADDGQAR